MIETTTINKLACAVVNSVLKYLTRTKYTVEPCIEDFSLYFSKYKQSTSLVDCLTYEDICDLNTFASYLPEIIPPDPYVTNCDGLANITLTRVSKLCEYTVSLETPDGLPSSFPVLEVLPNTIYQQAHLRVKVKGCNETEYATVDTGCINVANSVPPVCQLTFNQEYTMTFGFENFIKNSSGYVKTLRLYETDANGLLIDAPIDVDISPANLLAWTVCPLCSGISAGHLFFGSPNWAIAMKVLLDNVTYTRYGALNSAWSTLVLGDKYYIRQDIKHQPSGQWLGINRNDFLLGWINNSNTGIKITNPSFTISQTFNAMADEFSIPMDCGTVTGRVVMTGGDTPANQNLSDFITYVPSTYTFSQPASIVNLVSPTCYKSTLTASYTFNGSFEDVVQGWYDEDDNFISEELVIIVTEPGDYTFKIILDEGCLASETITVPVI